MYKEQYEYICVSFINYTFFLQFISLSYGISKVSTNKYFLRYIETYHILSV